jgi:hypothetical protein
VLIFALDPGWSDFYTIAGFLLTLMGFVVGVIGFVVAIWQIYKTKRAAEAALDAANRTLSENKEAYERFVGAYATRLLSELQNAVNDKSWKLANIRCHDLAELVATLPPSGGKIRDEGVAELVMILRDFGQLFAVFASIEKPKLARDSMKKWNELLQGLHQCLDQLRAPFRERNYDKLAADDPAGATAKDRSRPPSEDKSGTGELGPKPTDESEA